MGAHHPFGLVYRVIQPGRLPDDLPVHPNLLPVRIDPHAQLGNHAAVDFDPAGANKFFALAPAADASGGQHFLKSLARGGASGVRRLAGRGRAARWMRSAADHKGTHGVQASTGSGHWA